jgi:hypothetical protein
MTDIIHLATSSKNARALKLSHPEKFRRAFGDLLQAAKSQSLDPSSFLELDHASAQAFIKALYRESFWREEGDFEILEIALDFAGTINPEGDNNQFDAFLATFSANINRHWIVIAPLVSRPGSFGAVKPIRRTWKLANGWSILPPVKSSRGFAARVKQHGCRSEVDERLINHQALMTGYKLAGDAVLLFDVTGSLRSARSKALTQFGYFRWLSDAFASTKELRLHWTLGAHEPMRHLLMLDTTAGQLHRFPLNGSISLPYAVDGRYRQAVSSPLFLSTLGLFIGSQNRLVDRFRTAFQFFSRGFNENDRLVKLLFAIISLESLFSRDAGSPIKTTLADYATLIGFPLDERPVMHERVRNLYDLRSALVHRGKTDIIGESDEAENIAARVLVRALHLLHRFNMGKDSENAFFSYLRDRKLGFSR